MNSKIARQGFCIALLGSLAAVGCGPSKFAGTSTFTKSPEVIAPVAAEQSPQKAEVIAPVAPVQSPKTAVANIIDVTESFKQLRTSNSGSDQAYGVGVLSLTASGLLQGQKIISVERTGMSSDIQFTQCQNTGEPSPLESQNGTQLFSQTMNCFLLFKGLTVPVSLHRLYPGIARVARIGSTDSQNTYSSTSALCVIPEGDGGEPCSEKSGRIVLKDIISGKSVGDMGHEALPFPDEVTIAADLKSLSN
jgi:hypothetical protein